MPCEEEYLFNQRVVSLGGGTGHYTWLRGAVKCNNPELITAVPGTWDSGGVSGEQRIEEGILPPGDYIQCLFALMEDDSQVKAAIALLRDRTGRSNYQFLRADGSGFKFNDNRRRRSPFDFCLQMAKSPAVLSA